MKLKRKKLKNGLTVIMESRDLPIVAFSISNRFGASYEDSKVKGIAHFIEHLVFTGTKTRTHEDISREIEKKGGVLNAFTSHDITSFWFKLPSIHLFAGLEILTDILTNPTFNASKFQKEKKVIIEEIKMYHDMPMRHVFDQIEANLYQKPFGESVIGSVETISALDRDFVYDYFQKHYNPSNYIVTIVGNANFDKVCEFLENSFQKSSHTYKPKEIKLHTKNTIEERPGLDQAHFVFAFHAPDPNSPKIPILEVLDAHLASGMSSQLFLKIREERGLAYAVKSSLNTEKNYSYYSIYIGTTKEAIPEVQKIIIEEFENIKNMTEKQLEDAKQQLIGHRQIASEESTHVMQEILFAELANKAEDYYEQEEKIKAVTLQQVKELAKIENFATAAIVPK